MEINIQNLDNERIELDDRCETDFLDQEIQRFYPEQLNLHILVDKFGRDVRVDVKLHTTAHYTCHRCLAEYTAAFDIRDEQIYQIGEGKLDDSDEVIQLPGNTTDIDIDPMLAEMVLLNHPIKMLCKEDCKGICPGCGADLNREACRCGSAEIDPRWEALRKLIK
ncbi:MAG TPA: DUF177 domain-containing protein [Caldithrix abyssi]|uniref:DUF177 domain-containing protein n=1 Tax=Caldithrix abyssi TaxID=187145 RepID=A0A7V4U1Q3_CALAY|nr:DUF177 domain-containing protein [Caldithrix abyssi]